MKQSAAIAGGAAMASFTGCLGLGGGGGNYSNWMPEPDAFDLEYYSGVFVNPSQVVSAEDNLSEDFFDTLESLEDTFEATSIDFADFNSMFFFQGLSVSTTGVGNDEIKSELEDEDYDDDDYEGYTLYESPDDAETPHVIGVGNTLIYARSMGEEDPTEVAEILVDTISGEEPTWTGESEEVSALQQQVGTPTLGTISFHEATENDNPEGGQFENSIGTGISLNINGETTDFGANIGYEDSDDVDTDDLEEWADSRDGDGEFFHDVDDISVSQNGRVGTVSGTIDTDDLSLLYLL